MTKIKPISDLKNYDKVLKDVLEGEPVFISEDGKINYVILDINDYEKNHATIELLSKLKESEIAIKNQDEWLTEKQIKKDLGIE